MRQGMWTPPLPRQPERELHANRTTFSPSLIGFLARLSRVMAVMLPPVRRRLVRMSLLSVLLLRRLFVKINCGSDRNLERTKFNAKSRSS